MRILSKGIGKEAGGWLSLLLFLFAFLAPELPGLHARHADETGHDAIASHAGEGASDISGLAGAGEGIRASGSTDSHDCLLCLWKTHRDSQAYLSGGPSRFALIQIPSPGMDAHEASVIGRLFFSCPARAPPSLT